MPTLAFLGATGGTANAVLVISLLSQSPTYHCRALARTPSKLLDSLKAKGVDDTALSRLTIIQGDARDVSAVTRLISPPKEEGAVETVIFGIGAQPVLQWSLTTPIGLDQPNLCESSMATLLSAISALPSGVPKPTVVAVSTTGLWAGIPREVPLLYGPFYTWLLHGPHMDKKGMEELLWDDCRKTKAGEERRTGGFVIVRPTILTDGEERGREAVRWGGESDPAVGYTVGRKDVGRWIFERVVKGEGKAVGKDCAFTLSY